MIIIKSNFNLVLSSHGHRAQHVLGFSVRNDNIRTFIIDNNTHRQFSSLRRVIPFYSLIKLRFDHIVGKIGASIFNIYVKVCSSIFSPFTTKNDKPINAAKILVSFPLFWFSLSTNMVNKMFSYNVDVTMPVYIWALLDKYFIRVERENFGNGPGLYGSIISYDGTDTFYSFVKQLFTDEFLYLSLTGTDFEDLVTMRIDEYGNKIYYVNKPFRNALDSRLQPFNCEPYSEQFLVAVSSFYSDFSSKFYNKVVVVTRQPSRRINIEAGLHCFKNHNDEHCYVFHKSVDPKFDNSFFFNSFVILCILFRCEYFTASDSYMSDARKYGDGIPGNNEMYIDLTSIKFEDVFKTLLSMSILTHIGQGENRRPVNTSNALEVPFGGQRQFSTIANPMLRNSDVNRRVSVGTVYYSVDVYSFGYSRVDFGNGRVVIVNTS